MATLKEFLADVALDPQKIGAFIQDPATQMKTAERSAEDHAALRSGFPGMIYARLSGQPVSEAFQVREGAAVAIPAAQLPVPAQLPPQIQLMQLPPQIQLLQLPPQLPPQLP